VAFGVADIPSQDGRVAVVTGANGGLGLETARVLAGKGAHVVLAARDQAKTTEAVETISRSVPEALLTTVPLDLGSLRSVREAAQTILTHHDTIDLLVNNAGVMASPEGRTTDGFETQLGVDHLGHWALTAQLLPALLAAPAARVVTVTSMARYQGGPLDPENPHLRGNYGPWRAYGQAKLANYHFGLGLQQAFARARSNASSLIAHPGLARTELQPTTVRMGGAGVQAHFWAWLAAHHGMSAADAALPQLRAATDPAARGGQFYGPRYVITGRAVPLPVLRPGNAKAIQTLWRVSEAETGIALSP